VAIICTAPKGMLKRIVVKLSKPKDWMIRGPKVEMPPLGMLQLWMRVLAVRSCKISFLFSFWRLTR
jgi:hypothetical protein